MCLDGEKRPVLLSIGSGLRNSEPIFRRSSDRRQVLNLSSLLETPRFSNSALRFVGSGWRFSPLVKVLSGSYLSITTSQDRALSGTTNQRVNQVLANPYGDKSVSNYFTPAAFELPGMGTFGNMGSGSVAGPGTWQFDIALSRTFQLRESQRVEFRAEAFNITNSVHLPHTISAVLHTGQVSLSTIRSSSLAQCFTN